MNLYVRMSVSSLFVNMGRDRTIKSVSLNIFYSKEIDWVD